MTIARLLLVEDDEELAALIARKLRAADVEVVCARDADQAMEAVASGGFDAVWSDYQLGGSKNGVHVLRAAEALPGALLFLVTGTSLVPGLPLRAVVLDKKDLPNVLARVIAELRPPRS